MVAVGFGGFDGEVPGREKGAFVNQSSGGLVEKLEGDGAGAFARVGELVGEKLIKPEHFPEAFNPS